MFRYPSPLLSAPTAQYQLSFYRHLAVITFILSPFYNILRYLRLRVVGTVKAVRVAVSATSTTWVVVAMTTPEDDEEETLKGEITINLIMKDLTLKATKDRRTISLRNIA